MRTPRPLLPFWKAVARGKEQRRHFARGLRVALGLDTPALATSLLSPFCVEAITVGQAKVWVKLVKRYGADWSQALFTGWSTESRRGMRSVEPERLAWLASFADVCEALRAADESAGASIARQLLQDQWWWLRDAIAERRQTLSPTQRDQALTSLAGALLGWLKSAATVQAAGLRAVALGLLCGDEDDLLLGCLLRMLRLGVSKVAPSEWDTVGLDFIAQPCGRLLDTRLKSPARSPDDWSVPWSHICNCKLCGTLASFLGDSEQTRLEWPLAQQGRRHVHSQLDAHELPVSHVTRRSGSPYVLVLTKSKVLFDREAAVRRAWRTESEWLAKL